MDGEGRDGRMRMRIEQQWRSHPAPRKRAGNGLEPFMSSAVLSIYVSDVVVFTSCFQLNVDMNGCSVEA